MAKPIPLEEQCSEPRVSDNERWSSYHRCERKGKLEEEGKLWCKQHAPSTIVKRRVANQAHYEEKWGISKRQLAEKAERNHRANCYPDLLAACEMADHWFSRIDKPPVRPVIKAVLAAIIKANEVKE